MKKRILSIFTIIVVAAASFAQVTAPSLTGRAGGGSALVRHVMAVPQTSSGSNYLVSWRMLDTDDDYTTFDVLKNGEVVASDINSSTNWLDKQGSKTAKYQIVTKRRGEVVSTTEAITPWQGVFATLKLDRPADVTFHDKTNTYTPNDCSVADADGDGTLELVVKWEPSYPADNSQGGFTGPTFFDCYKILEADGKMTAQKLWRIDMGHNIRSGPHYVPFLFYDFDGDGKAEFVVKTGPGTIDGAGKYVSDVADEEVIRKVDNEKEYLNGGGQVMYGPEFLTIFNGETGKAIHTVYYNPNRGCFVGGAPEGRYDVWGDDYGNRSERYLACVAHLGTLPQPLPVREGSSCSQIENSVAGLSAPSLTGRAGGGSASAVFCRGYYTRSYLWAVDFDGKKLSTRWRHASLSNKTVMTTTPAGSVSGGSAAGISKDIRTYTKATYAGTNHCTAYSQGNHNISCADVDGDGMDEIIYGSAAIDHDGTLLWSTGLNHGDAIHVGDLMPDRPGLEVFTIHEDPPFGMHICDAATGELLIHMTGDGDTARGMAADFTEDRGYEFCYFGDGNMYNAPTGSIVGGASAQNFRIYWDGDVYDEIVNDKGGGHNQPFLEKYNGGGLVVDGKRIFENGYSVSCNGTKTTPCLQADIFGDWREEIIFYNGDDKTTLNIFSTALETAARVPCLMYDHVYRLGIAWQNVGYNQPPHLGYYLPDATAARFKMEQTQPLTLHYNNCTGATIVSAVLMDGSEVSADEFTLTQDEKLCNLTIATKTAVKDISHLVLQPITPANGLKNTVNVYISGTAPTGIDAIDNSQLTIDNSSIYDLQGRRVVNPMRQGIYINNGRKIVIK